MKKEVLFFDKNQFAQYKKAKTNEGYEIISITKYLQNFDDISEINEYLTIVDITSLGSINEVQYHAERLFILFPYLTIFIADNKHKEFFLHELRYCFEEFNDIEYLHEEIPQLVIGNNTEKFNHKKITDLTEEEIIEFTNLFSKQLYGHEKFKDDFSELLRNFRVFNKIGEHKILSLFLMGDSGVGKTEVARAIHKCLGGKRKLAKINFGNYSSDNSLNSLIGSPRGYIGSEEGEIFIRVKDSDTGLILIDEFEKSNSTLFNYFLDVLENGKMISSLAEEIDLNGFIIIFTSNISKENFTQAISPELRSRFDYKGYFTLLYSRDKLKFVEFRINSIIYKFNKNFPTHLTNEIKEELIQQIDVDKFSNMRDLNKEIKSKFVDYIVSKATSLRNITD
ncbi:AAA family ATPase [Chryseobacterium oranimense]|uniref:AAA family ATPase n=1 Tax=Chryseobacterium oranimense TaxID=421058 RepID=UPI0021AF382E|nr:AAA family ATPase [Chryseobacterium oranimense]UWX61766.1 AAA family ATPase [Chryseobacterium oranimense]